MNLSPETPAGQLRVARTAHAMLVVWGLFARQRHLVRELEQVPLPQRQGRHKPQTKLLEFLVAILAGCAYLRDISLGPHPLDHDAVTAEAWGQPAWADYSGVSRTLHACTAETVQTLRRALARFATPFIAREVVLALRQQGQLVYDGDLTGRPVSCTSTTYPCAAFGWMDDAVQLGYQAALVSFHSPTYGRVWLSVTPHPGDVVPCTQVEALVRAGEARTGVRPWRRTDLLQQRIQAQAAALRQAQETLCQRQERWTAARQAQADTAQAWRRQQQVVAQVRKTKPLLVGPARPYSQLAKAHQKVAVLWRRLRRLARAVQRATQALQQQARKVQDCQAALTLLQARETRLRAENATNRAPVRAIFRLDGGFGTGEDVALLIELGYDVYGKAYSNRVTQALRRRVPHQAVWTRVGANAEMLAWAKLSLDFCPYPLDVGLERFQTGPQQRYATLLHYGDDAVTTDLPAWFARYNARQTIEAGVKEGKHVFQMHHLKVRTTAGLAIQEEFTVLAANLVRWAAYWLHQQYPQAAAPFDRAQASPKQMVRVAANTTALVFWQPEGHLLLKFDELSCFAGIELRLGLGGAFQPPLPLFQSDDFSTI